MRIYGFTISMESNWNDENSDVKPETLKVVWEQLDIDEVLWLRRWIITQQLPWGSGRQTSESWIINSYSDCN